MRLDILPSPTSIFSAASGERDGDTPEGAHRKVDVGPSPTLLIVEDEGLVAMNMEAALADTGFRVLAVVDTEADAVEAALRLKPDVILMDITLREGDGIAAAKAIQRTLSVHIVFVSGNSDPTTLAAVQQTKFSGFIRKPFVTSRLAGLVREAITPKS